MLEPWEHRVRDPRVEPGAVSQIANAEELIRHFGHWPPFEDAELVSLHFDRGNHLAVADRGVWNERQPPALEAVFYVFNAEVAAESADRRPAHVVLVFAELHEVTIEGLNYQNPIQGLGVHIETIGRVNASCFRVNWGGTGMSHEVSLLCSEIAVRSVAPLSVSA